MSIASERFCTGVPTLVFFIYVRLMIYVRVSSFWFKSRTIIIRLKCLKEGLFLHNFANLLMSSCSCQKISFKNILIDKKSVTKTETRTSFLGKQRIVHFSKSYYVQQSSHHGSCSAFVPSYSV